jgi:hypothetical protein
MMDHESQWQRFLIDHALERAVDQIAREAAATRPLLGGAVRYRGVRAGLRRRIYGNPLPESAQ